MCLRVPSALLLWKARAEGPSLIAFLQISQVVRRLAPPDHLRIHNRQLGTKYLLALRVSAQVRRDNALGVREQGMSIREGFGVGDVDGRAEETLGV